MFEKKLENPTAKDVTALRKEVGQSDKKIENSATEFSKTPESGEFSHVGVKEFDIPNVGLKKSVGLFTKNGEFISENTVFASTVTEEIAVIKTGANKGKFMLKQVPVSKIESTLKGASRDLRLIELIGKKFEAKKVSGFALKEGSYDVKIMMVPTNTETNHKKLLALREPKDYHAFNIVE